VIAKDRPRQSRSAWRVALGFIFRIERSRDREHWLSLRRIRAPSPPHVRPLRTHLRYPPATRRTEARGGQAVRRVREPAGAAGWTVDSWCLIAPSRGSWRTRCACAIDCGCRGPWT